jgi:hypothetical protein
MNYILEWIKLPSNLSICLNVHCQITTCAETFIHVLISTVMMKSDHEIMDVSLLYSASELLCNAPISLDSHVHRLGA